MAIVAVGDGLRPPAIDEVLATFGVPLGGNRLDHAIAHRLVSGLGDALTGAGLPAEPIPGLGADARQPAGAARDRARRLAWFERQVRMAKIRLADAVLGTEDPDYRWAADQVLDVVVHDGDADIGIVTPAARAGGVRAVADVDLPDLGVLRTEMRQPRPPA